MKKLFKICLVACVSILMGCNSDDENRIINQDSFIIEFGTCSNFECVSPGEPTAAFQFLMNLINFDLNEPESSEYANSIETKFRSAFKISMDAVKKAQDEKDHDNVIAILTRLNEKLNANHKLVSDLKKAATLQVSTSQTLESVWDTFKEKLNKTASSWKLLGGNEIYTPSGFNERKIEKKRQERAETLNFKLKKYRQLFDEVGAMLKMASAAANEMIAIEYQEMSNPTLVQENYKNALDLWDETQSLFAAIYDNYQNQEAQAYVNWIRDHHYVINEKYELSKL